MGKIIYIEDDTICDYTTVEANEDTLVFTIKMDDVPFWESISEESIINAVQEANQVSKDLALMNGEKYYDEIVLPDDFELLDDDLTIYIAYCPETLEYIEKNPILKKFNLYFTKKFEITREEFDDLYESFKEYKNVKILLSGNSDYCTIEDYKFTVECIEKYANLIKSYDLSPLEQVMFAYDLVRNRLYVKEGTDESYLESRDITKVLAGNKIVCVGFQQIFAKVLDQLGIQNNGYLIQENKENGEGHVRSSALIDDDKYDIHGIYYFDPTWDNKKFEKDFQFGDRYRYFGLTQDQMKAKDGNKYVSRQAEINKETINGFKNFFTTKNLDDLSPKMVSTLRRSFYKYFEFMELQDALNLKAFLEGVHPELTRDTNNPHVANIPFESIERRFNKAIAYYYPNPIDYKKFIDAFIKVRKIESYLMPETYGMSSKDIQTLLSSMSGLSKDELLVCTLLGIESDRINYARDVQKYIKTKDVPLEEARVNLVRTLRKAYESKR